MFGIIPIFTGLVSLYILSFFYKFIQNYVAASKTGLDSIHLPLDQNHFVWMLFCVPSRPLLKKYLPVTWYNRIAVSIYGWEHHLKLQPFNASSEKKLNEKTGQVTQGDKTFLLSGCGRMELWTGNPTVAREILNRPKDFQQFEIVDLFVGIFGPNLLSTNGDIWSKHRRVVASAVTERISPVTWAESIRQVEGLLDEVCGETGGQEGQTKRMFDMMKKVTIHVLSGAGMGILREWKPKATDNTTSDKSTVDLNTPKPGFKLSYMEAIELINDNMTGPNVVPVPILKNWPSFLPKYQEMRRLGYAKVEFPLYTKEMLAKEKQRHAEGTKDGDDKTRKINIMSMLIAASDSNEDDTSSDASGKKRPALTDDELVSNLYIFTAAGFDTTSNTLSFAIALLMRYPKWQDWVFEEIDQILQSEVDLSDYQAIFPKCTRVLAFMFETLRLFPPISHEVKMVKSPQTLTMEDGRKVLVPTKTTVYVNNVCLHLDASIWRNVNLDTTEPALNDTDWNDCIPGRASATAYDIGSGNGRLGDEWRFRPSRWIESDGSMFTPPRGTFLPWSMGPRVCPGQRMAQVEFTAIFVAIFSRYRIDPVPKTGESTKQLHERIDTMMQDSVSKLTLEMDVFDIEDVDEKKPAGQGRGFKVKLSRRK